MPQRGQVVGSRYRLDQPLASGGMGSVWTALHLELDVLVAIKFQRSSSETSPLAEARFRREARAAAQLRHPHVVRVLDFGTDAGLPFIVMELLIGESLQARLFRTGSIEAYEARKIVAQSAAALAAAHEQRLIHRDVKPSNLFLLRDGESDSIRLLDFGLAKWLDPTEARQEIDTTSAAIVGSAAYMSPEQARGERVDHHTDGWSLAVVAYQMLTGATPFAGANLPDTLGRICAGKFDSPSGVLGANYLPLDKVFRRAFALQTERRFESVQDFARAFFDASAELDPAALRRPAVVVDESGPIGRERETASMDPAVLPRGRDSGRAPRHARLSRLGVVLFLLGGILALGIASFGARELQDMSAVADSATPVAGSSAELPTLLSPLASPVTDRAVETPSESMPPSLPSATKAPRARGVKAAPSRRDPTFGLEVPSRW